MAPPASPNHTPAVKLRTGIVGLDEILQGGLPADRFYLLRGRPGVGKTTLALQFLLAGVAAGERSLYITLSESNNELQDVATSHGWDLEHLSILELSALQLAREQQNTIFHATEVELGKTTDALLAEIGRVKPKRLVVDSVSELRLLCDTPLRYRRQMLDLKQFFAEQGVTALLLDEHAPRGEDFPMQSIAHGVITLEQLNTDYGAERRRIKINKLRGVPFVGGYHDAVILKGGVQVFPRQILHQSTPVHPPSSPLDSGLPELDALVGGGLDRGTSALLLGPAGSGKSTIALRFASEAARRGDKVFIYLFDENIRTFLARAKSTGMPMEALLKAGTVVLQQVDPAELAPGEFVHQVQGNVQKESGKVVLIDSLNGYLQAMDDAKFLTIQLHELLSYLATQGVVTLMTVAQHGLLGSMAAPIDITYLADTVIITRYFEHGGGVRKAISVIKKRVGGHENAIREFMVDSNGIRVGAPLDDFQGVLTGVPVFKGTTAQLLVPGAAQ